MANSQTIVPRVEIKFAINLKLKLPIARESMIPAIYIGSVLRHHNFFEIRGVVTIHQR